MGTREAQGERKKERQRDEIETERRGSKEEESNAEEKKNGVERDRQKKSRIFSI